MDNVGVNIFAIFSVVVFILVVWLIYLTVILKNHKRWHKDLNKALQKGELAEVVSRSLRDMDNLGKSLEELTTACSKVAVETEKTIQRVGIVRFDAFDDVGGELSFAAALLDSKGNGLVISAINGREQSRCYAKPITGGESKYTLSEEERQAIDEALSKSSWLKLAQKEEVKS